MIAINPVFIFLVLLGAFAIWVLLRHTFKHIGGAAKNLAEDTMRSMEIDIDNESKEKETIENE